MRESVNMSEVQDRYRRIEIVFLGLTVLVSAISSVVSSCAIQQSKTQAANVAKLEIRRDAALAAMKGDAEFDALLNQIKYELPFDIEERSRVESASMDDLQRLRSVVLPIVSGRRLHEASFQSSIAVWPTDVREGLMDALNSGNKLSDCYEAAALRALDEKEAAQIRNNLNATCRFLGNHYEGYRATTKRVFTVMLNEIYNAAATLGANPGAYSPPANRGKGEDAEPYGTSN